MGSKERFYADIMTVQPEVTGSCNLVIAKYPDGRTTRFVVDCGLFQEKEYSDYNEDLPFDADKIDFALITHNHVDHIGRLPYMIKNGFKGKIYSTYATSMFASLALYDSYRCLRDVSKRKHQGQLYSETHVSETIQKYYPLEFEKTEYIDDRIKVTYFINGHLIGAALILVQITYPGYNDINLLFTGDYNNRNMFFDVPKLPQWVLDLPLTIVQESTYGDMNSNEISLCFEKNVLDATRRGGTVLCPVFSLGRSQEILYILKCFQYEGKLSKEFPIYFDGKLAQQYTQLYLKAPERLGIKEEMRNFMPENLIYVDKSNRSSIVQGTEPKIIVTTSGMGTYGPAQTYIPEYISRKNCLIQFTGYTVEGSLGSILKNTAVGELVNIGSLVRIKAADVEYTTEFSAHAKADEMLEFLADFNNLKLVLVNHGEHDTKNVFSKRIVKELNPKYVGILDREYFFRVTPFGLHKTLPTKFI